MPLPPAHFLVGAGAAELVRGSGQKRWLVWLVGGSFAVLPDVDTALGILLGRTAEFHGVFTHTPLAVVVFALLVWLVAGLRWAGIAAAAYTSHLVVDLLENRTETSVQPLWPLSEATLRSVAHIFPSVPWRRGEGPEGAAESLLDPAVLMWLLAQIAVGLLGFVLCVLLRQGWHAARRGQSLP
ncbi:MAG: metal-dependent hydrolase [Gemmatimonadetes bacterium]|nr:metal-dependent hydrolase [Gemmatimonadota bacterium]